MSNSKLPNGGYSLTNGSNYMLDGFHFDTEYNNGVLEKARLPEAKGLANLPSGMIPPEGALHSDLPLGITADVDLNLEEITKEAGQEINIVDHSWLASQPKPDLRGQRSLDEILKGLESGNFDDPEVSSLKALQDLWGQASTDGLNIIPNENRRNESYRNTYSKEQSSLPGDDYRQEKEKLYRKLSYGENILNKVKDPLLQKKMASEYGLLGKVYIRAEHFPGLFNGKWDSVINKRCASCMYIIAGKDTAFDRFLGMKVIDSTDQISWKKAYYALSPKFEACGITKVSGSNFKDMVRDASLQLLFNKDQSVRQTWFQIQETKKISSKEAIKKLSEHTSEEVIVETKQDRESEKIARKLNRIASSLIREGFLDEVEVARVLASSIEDSTKILNLYKMASSPQKKSEYDGVGKETSYYNMRKAQDSSEVVPTKISRDLSARNKSCMEKVKRLIRANLISISEVEEAVKGKKDPEDKLASVLRYISKPASNKDFDGDIKTAHRPLKKNKPLEAVASKEVSEGKKIASYVEVYVSNNLLSEEEAVRISSILDENQRNRAYYLAVKNNQLAKKASFEGQHFHAHIEKKATLSGKSAKELQSDRVALWLRQKMTEGSSGSELDNLIELRFAKKVIDNTQDRVASLRSAHEGLSGHLYVDAESYLEEGCDKGALIHRANKIPTLLKTSKCGSCVFNSGGTCQKYNKVIVGSVNEVIDDPTSYQAEMIRLADASDSEKTASLFVNNYDPNQFNLSASDHIQLNDESPSDEKLGEVFFGGIEF